MTRIEHLLGARAGEEVELPVDLIVTDDWTTPALRAPLEELGCERPAVPIVLVRDHTLPTEHYQGEELERVLRLREMEEWFVDRFGAKRITGQGIQHHVLPNSGLLRPGMIVLGNDSHTPTLGAYGVAAFAAQPTTIAAAIHTGRVVLRVPETLRILIEGTLRPGTSARDASLTLLERLRDGAQVPRLATGKALEFVGSGMANLNIEERAVLANAVPEAVAVTATFPVDTRTVEALGLEPADLEPGTESRFDLDFETNAQPDPALELVLDLDTLRPSVARSGQPTDVVALEQLPATRVDRVFVGTCAGGTFEEIRGFAEALAGEALAVPTIVAPASVAVEERLRHDGILERLRLAGVTLLPPGCGPCFGFGLGRLADGEVAVVTGNRNGFGRMGSPSAQIHLTSGRSAGKAALTGSIGSDSDSGANPRSLARPRIVWPQRGNVIRLLGPVSTDDITPSAIPGVGASSDPDPGVLRRLLFHHLDPSSAVRDLAGTVIVADENFGVGSNRASSVRALVVAGVRAVIARSFAALYAMGARDEGLLLVTLNDDSFYEAASRVANVEVDKDAGIVRVGRLEFPFAPVSAYEAKLRAAGGIIPYLKSNSRRAKVAPSTADAPTALNGVVAAIDN